MFADITTNTFENNDAGPSKVVVGTKDSEIVDSCSTPRIARPFLTGAQILVC